MRKSVFRLTPIGTADEWTHPKEFTVDFLNIGDEFKKRLATLPDEDVELTLASIQTVQRIADDIVLFNGIELPLENEDSDDVFFRVDKRSLGRVMFPHLRTIDLPKYWRNMPESKAPLVFGDRLIIAYETQRARTALVAMEEGGLVFAVRLTIVNGEPFIGRYFCGFGSLQEMYEQLQKGRE
jgi:hypothetical protein